MSFITSQVWPTFHNMRALREITTRPILGLVSMLPDPIQLRARRRQAFLFVGGLGGLVVTMSAVIAAVLLGRIA